MSFEQKVLKQGLMMYKLPRANRIEIGLKSLYNSLVCYCMGLFYMNEGHTVKVRL